MQLLWFTENVEIKAQQRVLSWRVLCQYLQVTQATNQIVMNCADIDIITASFVPQGGEGGGQTQWNLVFAFINGIVVNSIVTSSHLIWFQDWKFLIASFPKANSVSYQHVLIFFLKFVPFRN